MFRATWGRSRSCRQKEDCPADAGTSRGGGPPEPYGETYSEVLQHKRVREDVEAMVADMRRTIGEEGRGHGPTR
jgi:hypothetical protein